MEKPNISPKELHEELGAWLRKINMMFYESAEGKIPQIVKAAVFIECAKEWERGFKKNYKKLYENTEDFVKEFLTKFTKTINYFTKQEVKEELFENEDKERNRKS